MKLTLVKVCDYVGRGGKVWRRDLVYEFIADDKVRCEITLDNFRRVMIKSFMGKEEGDVVFYLDELALIVLALRKELKKLGRLNEEINKKGGAKVKEIDVCLGDKFSPPTQSGQHRVSEAPKKGGKNGV